MLRWILVISVLVSCKPRNFNQTPTSSESSIWDAFKKPKMCAAVRGNGELVMAHYAALGNAIDHLGPLDGMAGTSSASYTSFVFESIMANPIYKECTTDDCRAERQSYLLKSMYAYQTAVLNTNQVASLLQIGPLVTSLQRFSLYLKQNLSFEGVKTLVDDVSALADYGEVMDDNFKGYLQFTFNPREERARLSVLSEAIDGWGSFSFKHNHAFLVAGPIDFAKAGLKTGYMGNFYAGRIQNIAGLADNVNRCAPLAKGKDWTEFTKDGFGNACERNLIALINQSWASPAVNLTSRLAEKVGTYAPIAIPSSALLPPEADAFRTAKANLLAGRPTDETIYNFFSKLRFFYIGTNLPKKSQFNDYVQQQREVLSLPWERALTLSPSEPGLTGFLEYPEAGNAISFAGWVDAHPVQILKDMGCDKVVYVTRKGENSEFAVQVAQHMGMTPEQNNAMLNVHDPNSSFSTALKAADYVACTDWNSFKASDREAMNLNAYHATLKPGKEPGELGCGAGNGW